MRTFTRSLCLLFAATPVAADTVTGGFETEEIALPSGAPKISTLEDESFLSFDGYRIRQYSFGGSLLATVATLPNSGDAGVFVVDPTETFAIVGLEDDGDVYRVELDGSGVDLLANVAGNVHAAFENNNNVIISSRPCGSCDSQLVRVNVGSGAREVIAELEGKPGPVAFDDSGDLLYATRSNTTPAPAGSTEILRFDALTVAQAGGGGGDGVFQESNGLVVIEVESGQSGPVGDWVEETQWTGFKGDSYYRWDGPNLFSTPGVGIMTFQFEIFTEGTYEFRIRNRHNHPQDDLENDCWMRMNGGHWDKIYSNQGSFTINKWNFHSNVEGVDQPAQFYFEPGVHTFQISGRSENYMIDRFHLFQSSVSFPLDHSLPESAQGGGNMLDEGDGVLVSGGYTGATSLAFDSVSDALFLAEQSSGASRILRLTSGLMSEIAVLIGDAGGELSGLEFLHGAGPEEFFPFQPEGGGKLLYVTESPAGSLERHALTPRRPDLELSGPGLSGFGALDLTVTNGPENGFSIFVAGPSQFFSPNEIPIVFTGLAPVFTGLDLNSVILLPLVLPLDGDGNGTLPIFNTVGLPGDIVVQGLVAPPVGGFVIGSTTTAVL